MRGTDSGRILSEINSWPVHFAEAFMVGGLLIFSEACVIAILALGLVVYNPVVFLNIAILTGIGALTIRSTTKSRLEKYSTIRGQIEPQTNTLISDAVRGFLEVTTFRASQAVRDTYLDKRWFIFRVLSNTTVLSRTDKLYEVLAVLTISGAIIIALMQGTPESKF